jgi:hypothetical protein
MRIIHGAALVATAIASLLAARPVSACGGCFHVPTPEQVTVVTGHRMAFSISPQQSVLWDQIEYSGSPSSFAWVLPVRAGAQIQLSHDELFAALDALTNPVITGPTPSCGGGSSGFGCSSASGSSSSVSGFANASASGGGGNGVQVLSQGVVGPYEQVTLKSTNPSALYDWLVANRYDIPTSIRPIIDGYVGAGFDFIALKLAPGQGVQAMQPVRVVTPGAGLALPLRMVAAGVGANVGITLYVIGDGRYQAQSFPNGVVQDSQLVWLHAQAQSNYESVAEQIMRGAGGRTWLTEFSQPVDLAGSPAQSSADGYQCAAAAGGSTGAGGVGATTFNSLSLPDLYYAQCLCLTACPELPDASDDAAGLSSPDGGCDTCAGFDDLSVALTGLDPSSTWLTRMRAILPASALTAGDLVLEAASSQTAVSNQYTVKTYDDPTYDPCQAANGAGGGGGSGGGCAAAEDRPDSSGRTLVVLSLAFLAASWLRRRIRSR